MQRFREFSSKEPAAERELRQLRFWKDARIFLKSGEQNKAGPVFVFYEGPPTANGRPGIHHVLSRVFKDIYVRYQGLRGRRVPRRAGWDCHGLPVEREVEKELGISTKAEIEREYGIEKFNELCRKSVLRYVEEWNRFTERMAFWVDLDDPYFTMDNRFIEAVWGLLKIIWDRGLIYQGFRVTPIDPVMGATMSDAEVDLGYREVEDPSLYVRFQIADDRFGANASFLVWTTTPWTLPSNVALALNPNETYVLAERTRAEGEVGAGETERLIFAAALQESALGPAAENLTIIKQFQGAELVGVAYRQILSYIKPDPAWKCFVTIPADFVAMDTGTGIVHIAPAYGADDLSAGQQHGLPVIHAVGLDGCFVAGTPHAGVFFKDADKAILKELKERGLVWRSERYKHNYPFGYRTGAPLLYFAKNAWYIRTTEVREELIRNNDSIRWVPEHIKEGRFGNWLRANRDWALSRERYWGTPLPVWTNGEGDYRIIGSVAELEALSGAKLGEMDLHRPYIDRIEWTDAEGKTWKRVPEVIDCWFDSGAMPYAQWGWPNYGQAEFAEYFPADFISEAIDQTRGWFYTLLAISTMVSDRASYKNVVCLGHVLDEKGEKMSKSKGNVVDPNKVFESHGADAIRWYFLTNSPAGAARRVGQPGAKNDPVVVVHSFLNMLTNSVNFFTLYANIDNIKINADWRANPIAGAPEFARRAPVDRWILSANTRLIETVTSALDDYDCQKAGKAIEEFVDALSNWYIRRNRRRFWKGALDADKLAAYDTLYRCLVTATQLIAPFAPFIAEELYQLLVAEPLQGAAAGAQNQSSTAVPESVHLAGWPAAERKAWFDEDALAEGELIKLAAFLGRAARAESGVKVRQPLGRLMVHVQRERDRRAIENNADVLLDELNVKQLEFIDDAAGVLEYRVKPNLPRIGKQLGPRVREVQQYLAKANVRELALAVKRGQGVAIPSPDGVIELAPEDFLVESTSAEGVSGQEAQGLLVALDTRLTPELIEEGFARDLVRNVQELRKNSGLNVTDRIKLVFVDPTPTIVRAIAAFRNYIAEETLAELPEYAPPGDAHGETTAEIEAERTLIRIWKTHV